MSETSILSARFNPKVKQYWLLLGMFTCVISMIGIPFIPIVALIIWLVAGRILAAMSAQLLTRKLVVKRGVFFKEEKSIPLEKITDVALSQGPLMRQFGLYRLSFETAGQSGQGALVSLLGVIDAAEFREAILKQKDEISQTSAKAEPQSEDSQLALLRSLTYSVKNIEQMLVTLLDEKR
ncbi:MULTISPECIES: PH domain-containing protein [Pseudoalteromonas]|jgi:putative membrane protein|uniref:Membrane protein n=1 Tax=Pseudoalteromonas lipolytica TaxID=570156 RepID=A0AAD0RWE7_9GAMM|nr:MULTISPECIES: PH domain-containing protein [Pseudoalteromonas]AXV64039.1 PH domain-containing protein [Pseudoalteromonas donghaensis]EWH04185.1 membrane protein [Pseudoalteromonas lipolytica SCSIO 04301]MBE0352287.1 putative membrane protein [Pseudoalteromonas lipolytica LMEB 39]MCC9660609.1 PH domain-containing protein [Pseudoalteromonas sp. MB41]QLJ08525.1 PH domain-containing protein [Pseudoalteromonas sp. JSTW]|tara:strand:+ start:1769 stop:2308 length:540 start_codon:yes stop_codon:yes gene_type:complete